MATTPTRGLRNVDDLLAAVKQLPAAELREFQQQFAAWSGQNGNDDEALLAVIRTNSALPAREQRRFNRLRRKRQAETLTGSEEQQLQDLWRRVEQMTATRLEALGELARRRGTDVRTLMRQLGLAENRDVF
jgi:hypothetical protein